MNSLPKNFCVAPFVQCTTHPSGSFSPCPYLGGTTWKSESSAILSKWQSQDLEQLRQDFVSNRKSPICNRCWHEEDHGKKSLRLRLFDPVSQTTDYSFIDPNTFATELQNKIALGSYLSGPEVLTIKNGNICNAKCRVCHPGDSNRWIADAEKLQIKLGQQYYAVDQQERNWTDDQLDQIVELSAGLKRLELFGGEPMYNKQVFRILERIIQLGHSKNITLYINTNGSVDLTQRLPDIRYFKEVEIGVSIDGVGTQFDYIRHGLSYDTVQHNIRSWQAYFDKHQTKYYIDSISTVQIMNVYYLPELKQAVKDLLPLSPFWNLLVDPAYLCIKNLPTSIKQAVRTKLSCDPEFADLVSVLDQPSDPQEWQKFLEITRALDQIRNESFADTFPELANMIDTD